ncbi:MAG: response regulator [Ardenticatenales bacterium]|nr:response regulator [Ardenticatenales bacterium]
MKRILIVEDNPNNRDMLTTILKFHGFETIQAEDGQQAIEKARETVPDLILMDLSMPVMNGWDATRQIKQDPALAHIPIVAVSAYDMLQDKEAALAAGCDAFLSKPLNMFALKERLEAIMAKRDQG